MAVERQKLTREFVDGHAIYFLPKTADEAIKIQESLFALGFEWVNTGAGIWEPETCVKKGIGVKKGKIMPFRPDGSMLVHLENFEVREALSLENLHEQFNALSAKVDHLTALVEKVVSAIEPKPIEKPLSSVLGPKKPNLYCR